MEKKQMKAWVLKNLKRNLKAWESVRPFPKIKILAIYPRKKENVGNSGRFMAYDGQEIPW